MNHHDGGQLPLRLSRTHEIAAHLLMAVRRRIDDVGSDNIRVGEGHLLRQRIIRAKGREQGCSGHTADGEGRRLVEELALADLTVYVEVVEFEDLRRKILCRQPPRSFLQHVLTTHRFVHVFAPTDPAMLFDAGYPSDQICESELQVALGIGQHHWQRGIGPLNVILTCVGDTTSTEVNVATCPRGAPREHSY
ncbi:hypothetical protein CHELA20_10766 [Hyphomicrobiales bacterium]|nr:hypothetical protein CHELA20_10766 [Hyphomicrobiales bacterium]CAH1693636.1 hypothetical protein CHELA41_50997 [Hyphomicrobiales bacterium]